MIILNKVPKNTNEFDRHHMNDAPYPMMPPYPTNPPIP